MKSKFVAESFLNFLKFVFAEYAVVYEDAGKARIAFFVAQGAIDEDGRNGGIDAAREGADGASGADLLFDLGDGGVDEVLRRPCGFCAADLENEVAQDFCAVPCVVNFRMKLDGEPISGDVLNAGDGVCSFRG